MKSLYSFLVLICLSVGVSVAQSQPTTTGSSLGTRPASTTSTGTNRQQELYDQYHGITKKPATSAPVATPPPARTETITRQSTEPTVNQANRTASRPERIESGSSNMSGTRIGFRGGITRFIYTEKIAGVDPTIGFVGGVTFNVGGGTLSFQPEINYARYSIKSSFGFIEKGAADFFEVPLFLKISSGTYAGNRFFVNVGPSALYLASVSTDGKKESLDGRKGRFGFGAAAGIGAALKAGPGHVTLEVRGTYPLGDTDNGFSTDSKTILGQAAVGYVFPLGGR